MNRTLRSVMAVAMLFVLTACTQGAPTGATLPPLTTAALTSASAIPPAATTEVATPQPASSVTEQTTTDVTVPPEASALPLPTEQINIPADNSQEEADRAAIEVVWREVWDLYTNIDSIPEGERRSTVDQVTVGSLSDELLAVGEQSNKEGVTSYGTPILHPYWYRPVGGQDLAVLGDCRDTSNFGDVEIATGDKKTVGVSASNTVGQFTRVDGQWKLWSVVYIDTPSCTS